MPTLKSRINISLGDDTKLALMRLAARDDMPTATKAERLLELALELEEDQVWDKIAAKRDQADVAFLNHDQVFNEPEL